MSSLALAISLSSAWISAREATSLGNRVAAPRRSTFEQVSSGERPRAAWTAFSTVLASAPAQEPGRAREARRAAGSNTPSGARASPPTARRGCGSRRSACSLAPDQASAYPSRARSTFDQVSPAYETPVARNALRMTSLFRTSHTSRTGAPAARHTRALCCPTACSATPPVHAAVATATAASQRRRRLAGSARNAASSSSIEAGETRDRRETAQQNAPQPHGHVGAFRRGAHAPVQRRFGDLVEALALERPLAVEPPVERAQKAKRSMRASIASLAPYCSGAM